MAAPAQVEIWIGLDVGKEFHHAVVLNDAGEVLADQRVTNGEAEVIKVLDTAAEHGVVGLVIDQPGSIAQLALALARQRQVPVAYIPGLVMRRAADLYPGEAKTDRRDAYVIADTARTRRDQIHWLSVDDDLLVQLRVLNGLDVDLAADATRHANRLRDALTSISPALERAVGTKLQHAGVRDLLAKYPTPTALRAAGKTRIRTVTAKRSPRMGASITERVWAALGEQTVSVPAEATLGRVIAELAVELGRVRDRRDTLETEIEEVFLTHPLGPVLISLPGIGPRTGARILAEIGDGSGFAVGLQARRLRRARPRHPTIGHLHQRRAPQPTRQPPPQERHVPLRVRSPARPRLACLLRPQTPRRQTPQRRTHLPRPPTLRRHPRHAPHRQPLPHQRPTHPTNKSGLNPLTNP